MADPKRTGKTVNPDPVFSNPDLADKSWTTKAFVDLNTSIVRLEVSIEHLVDKTADAKKKTERLSGRIEKLEHKMIAAASIVTVALLAGGFVANKAIDFGLKMAEAKITLPTAITQLTPPEPQPVKTK